jgi:hypothetical protein
LKADPGNLTAKLGAEWLLTQLVPLWHIPMMNEQERNQAFHDGLQAAVTPESTMFEIGTGSGLLAMMAARLGARFPEALELSRRKEADTGRRNAATALLWVDPVDPDRVGPGRRLREPSFAPPRSVELATHDLRIR